MPREKVQWFAQMAAATCWVRDVGQMPMGIGTLFRQNEFLVAGDAQPVIGTVEFDDDFTVVTENLRQRHATRPIGSRLLNR
jgi:hypothetical protein